MTKGWLIVAGTSIAIVLGIWIGRWKRRAAQQTPVSEKWLSENGYQREGDKP